MFATLTIEGKNPKFLEIRVPAAGRKVPSQHAFWTLSKRQDSTYRCAPGLTSDIEIRKASQSQAVACNDGLRQLGVEVPC